MKLDVEGAEWAVLQGAQRLLDRRPERPVILAELQDATTIPWGYPARVLYDFLAERGYIWFAPTPAGDLEPSPRRHAYDTLHNLVAVPQEEIPNINKFIK